MNPPPPSPPHYIVIKLSFNAKFNVGAKATTPLLDFTDALGACVTVAYTVACLL